MMNELHYREEVRPEDVAAIRRIVESSGFFSRAETEIAVELIEERLVRGTQSSYQFVFADLTLPSGEAETIGYTCFGEIPCTTGSYDLYWIAVLNQQRGKRLGGELLARTESSIAGAGGRAVYAETSGRSQYEATHHFYLKYGFSLACVLKDFYDVSDDKHVYVKFLR